MNENLNVNPAPQGEAPGDGKKPMKNKTKLLIIEIIIVLALVIGVFAPKQFTSAMSRGFDPGMVTEITAELVGPEGDIEVTLKAGEPEFGEFINQLMTRKYQGKGEATVQQQKLDYMVRVSFWQGIGEEQAEYCLRLTGNEIVDMARSNEDHFRAYSIGAEGALEFQQGLVDLLLSAAE